MTISHLYTFAQANYGCDAYGAGSYNNNQCATTNPGGGTGSSGSGTTTGASASGAGGILSNTGYPVLIPMALAAAILIAAVIYGFKRWRRRQSA